MTQTLTYAEFMARYNPDGSHPVTQVNANAAARDESPFIVITDGSRTVVINPLVFDDHLCIDVHPFLDGKDATAGVFGMSDGRQWSLPAHGTTSHGWPSARLIAVLVGKQEAG